VFLEPREGVRGIALGLVLKMKCSASGNRRRIASKNASMFRNRLGVDYGFL
jgi:hypothetical protein